MSPGEDARLDAAVDACGPTNFSQDCQLAGSPARLLMNQREVLLVDAAPGGSVSRAPFDRVSVDGAGLTRQLRLGDDTVAVTFADEQGAARFARVLGVRRGDHLPSPADHGDDGSAPGRLGLVPAEAPAQSYQRWTDYTLWTTSLLLVIAWLDLAAGLATALILLGKGDPLLALLWLGAALAGCAVPLCLASLARMTVYRFQAQDARA